MATLTINNRTLTVPDDATLLSAAALAGIKIPTLCNLEGREAIGACRVCVVEVEGARTLAAACSTPVVDGMVVRTNSARAREARRKSVELLLSEHDGNCQTCNRNQNCELREVADAMGIEKVPYEGAKAPARIDDSTPALVRDNSKCIKCRRCVTVCAETQGVGALFPQGRGFDTVIGPAFTMDLDGVACVQCGQCAAVCPVGAIEIKDNLARVHPELCIGCKACVKACPRGIIHMVPESRTTHVLCSSKDKGPVAKKACKVACIGCRLCVKLGGAAFEMDGFLAKRNYHFPARTGDTVAVKCPGKCIVNTGDPEDFEAPASVSAPEAEATKSGSNA